MTVPVSEIQTTVDVREFEGRALPAQTHGHFVQPYKFFGKRLLDIIFVVASAVVTVPVIGLFAILVMAQGGNPFYTQMRVGRGGKSFRMYKLRTMVPNSDELLANLLQNDPDARAEWNSTQKLRNDPRITPLGHFLRKTSMDELPQLWNVLLGDMSLVGPRPMMESQVALYHGSAYYRLRPGATGFWQISDRNACSFADRAKFDEAYDRSLSLKTDIAVIFRTIVVMLRGTGC